MSEKLDDKRIDDLDYILSFGTELQVRQSDLIEADFLNEFLKRSKFHLSLSWYAVYECLECSE